MTIQDLYLKPRVAIFRLFVPAVGYLLSPISRRWIFCAPCMYTQTQPLKAIKIEDTKKVCVWSCRFKILRVIFFSYSSEYKNRPSCLSKETAARRRRLNLSTSGRFSANRGHPPVELKKTRSEIAPRSSFKESYMNHSPAS